jgi:predicted MPP superfamily phosphohydrolase
MEGGSNYCAHQAHHAVQRVLFYLETMEPQTVPPNSKRGTPASDTAKSTREERQQLFGLPQDRLESAIQMIEAAGFHGSYPVECLQQMRHLLEILVRAGRSPAKAARYRNQAWEAARRIQERASQIMGGHVPIHISTQPDAHHDDVLVRILLLSDLHCGQIEGKPYWPNVESQFLTDLSSTFQEANAPGFDAVIFCGDMVYSGQTTEFSALNLILEKIWNKLRQFGNNPPLITIPGNHDLRRPPSANERLPSFLHVAMTGDAGILMGQILSKEQTDAKSIVESTFENYRNWRAANTAHQRKTECKPLFNEQCYCENALLGDFACSLIKDSRRLGIVGLNTTFLQLKEDDYEGRLGVHCSQLNVLCDGRPPDWAKSHDGCVLITHHPIEWLTRESRKHFDSEIYLPHFCLHIHGHMHEPDLTRTGEHGVDAKPHLQVPSLFGSETYIDRKTGQSVKMRTHGYSVLEISLGEGKISYRYRTRIKGNHDQMVDARHFDRNIQQDGWSKIMDARSPKENR